MVRTDPFEKGHFFSSMYGSRGAHTEGGTASSLYLVVSNPTMCPGFDSSFLGGPAEYHLPKTSVSRSMIDLSFQGHRHGTSGFRVSFHHHYVIHFPASRLLRRQTLFAERLQKVVCFAPTCLTELLVHHILGI